MSLFDELPPPPVGPSVRTAQTQRQFAATLNAFALIYHFLHKFLMPLVVMRTASLPLATEKIDWWWLYHAVLAVFLARRKTNFHFLRWLVFVGFGGLSVQCLESVNGRSWHSVSLWLTSASTFAVLVYLLRLLPRTGFYPKMLLTAAGLVFGASLAAALHYFF